MLHMFMKAFRSMRSQLGQLQTLLQTTHKGREASQLSDSERQVFERVHNQATQCRGHYSRAKDIMKALESKPVRTSSCVRM